MQLFLRLFLLCLLFFALLGGCAGVRAQNENARASTDAKPSVVVAKPVRKSNQVLTDDPIALLAVRRTPVATTASAAADGTSLHWALDEAGKKAAEIAALQQQIKDKQKRIALLMRLFVRDEKAFIVDPASANGDSAIAERRRYEQDELRWETAELGKLQTSLEELQLRR